MSTFECEGSRLVVDEITAKDEYEAARKFAEKHGFAPFAVGDREVMGSCEVCGMTLFDGDNYAEDDDGVMWCEDDCGAAP